RSSWPSLVSSRGGRGPRPRRPRGHRTAPRGTARALEHAGPLGEAAWRRGRSAPGLRGPEMMPISDEGAPDRQASAASRGTVMAEAQVCGIRLYYEEHGAGAPILCIHGTSSSALVWGAAVGTLARLGRVIVYDRRGCTRSERPEPYERTSVAEHADDAAVLLDALE